MYKEVPFDTTDKSIKIETQYAKAFQEHPELRAEYDEILVLHRNNLATFVPSPLFDEGSIGSYMQYNTKVFETDFFASDTLATYSMHTVYIPYVHVNNFFIDQFGTFDYKHTNSILVSKLLDASKNNDTKTMSVHFQQTHFEILVIQNQKLLLFNSFEYQSVEDFIYYILFTAEQLNLNPDNFPLQLIGAIDTHSPYYEIAYKYIRNVHLIDLSSLQQRNTFSEAENRKHYILFNS